MMLDTSRIIVNPEICHGKPVVRGTRTMVSVILDHIAAGDTFEDICRNYDLTPDDIRACVAFANMELSRVSFRPMPQPGI